MLDILFVTYNSEKWIKQCIASIAASHFDLHQVSLIFVDNASTDQTLSELETIYQQYQETFSQILIKPQESNAGFGRGNNIAASCGRGDYLLFLNIDTQIYPDTLEELFQEIHTSNNKVGLWELRQLPYEHPKYYHPFTRETSWSSGACFAMRRSLFEKIHGFDDHIFMYCEDVDISWRIRAEGYHLKYCPKAAIIHYSYAFANQIKPVQFVSSIINNLYLRHKFGTPHDIKRWYVLANQVFHSPEPFEGAHRMLINAYFDMEPIFKDADAWRKENDVKINACSFSFLGFDYEAIREGAFFENNRVITNKKVSIVIKDPADGNNAKSLLQTILSQTYSNLEIIFFGNISTDFQLYAEQSVANYPSIACKYIFKDYGHSTKDALHAATGEYICILDNDVLLFADHIETLLGTLQEKDNLHAAHTHFATVRSLEPPVQFVYSSSTTDSSFLTNTGMFLRNNALDKSVLNLIDSKDISKTTLLISPSHPNHNAAPHKLRLLLHYLSAPYELQQARWTKTFLKKQRNSTAYNVPQRSIAYRIARKAYHMLKK